MFQDILEPLSKATGLQHLLNDYHTYLEFPSDFVDIQLLNFTSCAALGSFNAELTSYLTCMPSSPRAVAQSRFQRSAVIPFRPTHSHYAQSARDKAGGR